MFGNRRSRWRALQLLTATGALAAGLAGCGADGTAAVGAGGDALSVAVSKPAPNATVIVPFTVTVATSVPLGTTDTGRHHVHIWFDDHANDYRVVEAPTVEITDLAAGQHVMHVSLRNANHTPAGVETQLPITVGGAPANPAPAGTEPDQPYGY
jgi:hypothetical protein